MRAFRLAATLLALLASPTSQAAACSCGEASLSTAMEFYDVVFVGKVIRLEVISSEMGTDRVRAQIQVSEAFKGNPASVVEFATHTGCCDCSFHFEIAQEYLLFAVQRDGFLETNVCSRSDVAAAAKQDIDALRANS